MKMKKKGKVYPSPPSTQSPSSSSSSHFLYEDDSLSVLRLLPATILVLVSVLSPQDREVLAYLIARGNCGRTSSSPVGSKKKTKTKKNKSSINHKPPVFDCDCFDCYTNYWFRWDSSPNRELIHEIIDAFENHHLTIGGENSAFKNKSKKGKKKEKPGPYRRVGDKDDKPVVDEVEPVTETTVSENHVSSPDNSPRRLIEAEVAEREPQDEVKVVQEEESTVVFPAAAATEHKGLARKVLPDVLSLLNSNFWRLWNPNA